MLHRLRTFWPKGNQRESLGQEPPEWRLLKTSNVKKIAQAIKHYIFGPQTSKHHN